MPDAAACTGYNEANEACPARYDCKRFEWSFNKVPWQAYMETPDFTEDGCDMKVGK